jgi:hypothetical protein
MSIGDNCLLKPLQLYSGYTNLAWRLSLEKNLLLTYDNSEKNL